MYPSSNFQKANVRQTTYDDGVRGAATGKVGVVVTKRCNSSTKVMSDSDNVGRLGGLALGSTSSANTRRVLTMPSEYREPKSATDDRQARDHGSSGTRRVQVMLQDQTGMKW